MPLDGRKTSSSLRTGPGRQCRHGSQVSVRGGGCWGAWVLDGFDVNNTNRLYVHGQRERESLDLGGGCLLLLSSGPPDDCENRGTESVSI